MAKKQMSGEKTKAEKKAEKAAEQARLEDVEAGGGMELALRSGDSEGSADGLGDSLMPSPTGRASPRLRGSRRVPGMRRRPSTDAKRANGGKLLAKAAARSVDNSALRSVDHADLADSAEVDTLLALCDEDELRDLAFTFMACDIDNSKSLEVDELWAMLVMESAFITEEEVDSLMRAGKAHYEKWCAESASGVDQEVVIRRMMKAAGMDTTNQTKHGAERTFAALNFQEKNQQLGAARDFFDSTVTKAAGGVAAVIDQSKTIQRLQTSDVILGELWSQDTGESFEARRSTKAMPSRLPTTGGSLEGLPTLEDVDDEPELSLSFPEYVFTMQCKELREMMEYDAHKVAVQMRAFRNAFESVDVDGQNMLEYDDLEMVTLTLNPHLLLSSQELLNLWRVITQHAIIQHAENARKEAAVELEKQRRKDLKKIDQTLLGLDKEQVHLESRLKLRFTQDITPSEETWIRKQVSQVNSKREELLPARQKLIDILLKPQSAQLPMDSEPPEPEPEPAPEALPMDGVVKLEGLVVCQYGSHGKSETVWVSVATDGAIVFRDVSGMPVNFHGKWHGKVTRTANALKSSVREGHRGKKTKQAVRIDLFEQDSCGDEKYTMRRPPKKKLRDGEWIKLTELRKTLQAFAIGKWDDCKAVTLDFNQFLHGMALAQNDPSTKQWINVFEPNRWELLSLIIDTPVSEVEDERIYRSMSAIERVGVGMLRRKRVDMDMERVRFVVSKAANGALRKLDEQQMDKMTRLHRGAVITCAMIGLVFGAVAAIAENFLCYFFAIDGFKDTYWVCTVDSQLDTNPNSTSFGLYAPAFEGLANPDEMLCSSIHVNASACTNDFLDTAWVLDVDESRLGGGYFPPGTRNPFEEKQDNYLGWTTLKKGSDSMVNICRACECVVCGCATHAPLIGRVEMGAENKQTLFWGFLGPVLAVAVAMEVAILLYFAMKYTTLVAWALDFRLAPLNKDRAFVAESLVRAAFELGNPDSPLLGVDPQQDEGDGSKVLLLIVFKMKVFLTGLALKLLIGLTFPAHAALWLKPWLGMVVSTVGWDGYTVHSLMVQARIRGFGVYASVELFNDIMDTAYPECTNVSASMSSFAKVQVARAIGVAIVIHGSLHPSMELLLRHALQFLGLVGTRVVAETGILDNREAFLQDLFTDSPMHGRQTPSFNTFETEDDSSPPLVRRNPVFEMSVDSEQRKPAKVKPVPTKGKVKRVQDPAVPNPSTLWMAASADSAGVERLSKEDQIAVLSVHLLAFLLDGYLDPEELELWETVCNTVGAGYYPDRVLALCRRFSNLEPITAQDLRDCYDPQVEVAGPSSTRICKRAVVVVVAAAAVTVALVVVFFPDRLPNRLSDLL